MFTTYTLDRVEERDKQIKNGQVIDEDPLIKHYYFFIITKIRYKL